MKCYILHSNFKQNTKILKEHLDSRVTWCHQRSVSMTHLATNSPAVCQTITLSSESWWACKTLSSVHASLSLSLSLSTLPGSHYLSHSVVLISLILFISLIPLNFLSHIPRFLTPFSLFSISNFTLLSVPQFFPTLLSNQPRLTNLHQFCPHRCPLEPQLPKSID